MDVDGDFHVSVDGDAELAACIAPGQDVHHGLGVIPNREEPRQPADMVGVLVATISVGT